MSSVAPPAAEWLDGITVSTYNLLSGTMSTPKFFATGNLDKHTRIDLLINRLVKMMDMMSIITLQEVDVWLASKLHKLFIENGYYCLTSHYSTMDGRDYYGVVIAFPIGKYSFIESGQVAPAKHITAPPTDVVLSEPLPPKKVTNTVYDEALCRDSRVLYVKLSDHNGNEFYVFTYHMPCAFWWPAVMTLHADALMIVIDNITNGGSIPYVLAGDFNTMPNTPIHRFICENKIDDKEFLPYATWTPSNHTTSPIDVNAGDLERASTQCINAKGDLFRGNIDYIFVSKQFKVNKVIQDTPTENMPNETEGSDHLPVTCVLEQI
jgi:endonuclease/exonuclease/phosphatase family metal-dependent hydrolase